MGGLRRGGDHQEVGASLQVGAKGGVVAKGGAARGEVAKGSDDLIGWQ